MCVPSTAITCTERDVSLTVVVPVYNNAGSLAPLHARLLSTLTDIGSAFEIIYVNDASTDESLEALSRLHSSGDQVTIVDLAENAGQSAAVLAALGLARGDIVVTIDADLENNPEDIPALVAAVRGGADLACGVRRGRNAPFWTRRAPSMAANRLVGRALGVELADWGCGLNAVKAEIAQRLLAERPLPPLPKIEAALLSSWIAEVPVSHDSREHGQSGYSVRRLCAFAATFLSSFSIRRAFRRLLRRTPVVTGNHTVDAHPATPHAFAAFTVRTIVAFAAWSALTGAALIVRALRRNGSARDAARFRIREIREPRDSGLGEPSLRVRAQRNRPNDIVAQRGEHTKRLQGA